MAFVYRSHNPSNSEITPGPGSYELEKKKESSTYQQSMIPLVQIPRKLSPGPGAYDLHRNSPSQVVSAVFKSEEIRFKEERSASLGPGYYDKEPKFKLPSSHRPKIIEQLMYAGTYQNANSIPFEKRQQANVGPGYYDVSLKKHSSQVSDWSRQSTKQEDIDTSVGPGHYDVDRFYRYRERKLVRQPKAMSQQQPKCYVKKGLDNKVYYSFQKSSTPESDDSQYEYIDDSTPGPGYYSTQSTEQSTYAKFITKAPRFAAQKQMIPGPGYYDPSLISLTQQIEFTKDQRFRQKTQVAPGPTTYSPKTSMKDKVIQKLLQSPGQEMSSQEPRFPRKKPKPTPGPGTYDPGYKPKEKQQETLSPFKSRVHRQLVPVKESPPPGIYDVSYGSIEERIRSQIEYNDEQLIEKPPFGVGEKRWKQPIIEESEDERIERTSNYKPPVPKDPPAFGQAQKRFVSKIQETPDPLQYNLSLPWNKKTFNYLYLKK